MTEVNQNAATYATSDAAYDPFVPVARLDIPSTPGQLEICRSEQLCLEANCAHNESFSVHLKGPVDDQALDRALRTLVDFHEALRGHFSKDRTRFIIEPSAVVPIVEHDLSHLSPAGRTSALAELCRSHACSACPLENGPLFLMTIVRMSADERVVLLGAHRSVCDGWSLDVLLEDFSHLYSAFAGKTPLPSIPKHSFRDFTAFRATPDYSAKIQKSLMYWREIFSVPPQPVNLSHGGRRPDLRTYGAFHTLHHSPADLLAAVRAFSRTHNVSFFSVLLSAFAVLIHRHAGTNDFVIGIPIAGHPDAAMEDAVGYLASVVPLRIRVDAAQPFAELCRDTNRSMLDARENAAVHFGEVASALVDAGAESRPPLVTVAFSHMHKYSPAKLVFAGCSVDYQLNPRAFETYDLSLNVIEGQDSLELLAHANSRLHTQEWLSERMREFENLLQRVCGSPKTAIEKLSLLPMADPSCNGTGIAGVGAKRAHEPSGPTVTGEAVGNLPPVHCSVETSPTVPGEAPSDGVKIEAPIIVALQRGKPDRLPLLCLFGIQLYLDVAMGIDCGTPVLGIHVPMLYVPGRTPRPSLTAVAGHYLAAVRKAQPKGPYQLAGLCFGGVVAYQTARLLEQQGEEVSLVVLFDAVLPHGRHIDYAGRLVDYARNPRRTMSKALNKAKEAAAPLLSQLRSSPLPGNGKDKQTNELIDLPFGTPEAAMDVTRLAASKPYLDAHLLAFRASRPALPDWDVIHPDMGWTGFARSVQFCDVESHHLGIVRPPHAKKVAQVIMGALNRTSRSAVPQK